LQFRRNKYIFYSGTPSRVDHHYRSKKMGLWLDLLPQIHRPDAFDPIYHLLDDFDNSTSFDDIGTKKINLELLRALPLVTSTSAPYRYKTQPKTTVLSDSRIISSKYTTQKSRRTTPTFFGGVVTNPYQEISVDSTHQSVIGVEGSGSTALSTSLGVTIAVGLALLLLNLIVFAGAYCQWTRLRRSRSERKAEQMKQLADVEYVGTRLRHTDADCSTAFEPNNLSSGPKDANVRTGCHHYNDRQHVTMKHVHNNDDSLYCESHPLKNLRTATAPGASPAHSYAMLQTTCDGSPKMLSLPTSALLRHDLSALSPNHGAISPLKRSTLINSQSDNLSNHKNYSSTVV